MFFKPLFRDGLNIIELYERGRWQIRFLIDVNFGGIAFALGGDFSNGNFVEVGYDCASS